MSYCVHCGVRLGESERRCPLCGTPVLDPLEPIPADAPRAYPVRTPEQELKRNKRFILLLLALVLLLPAALCLVIDCLLGDGLLWSLYASGAMILLFITAAVPLVLPRYRAYAFVITAFISLNLYLWMVERVSGSVGWFLPIAFPALAVASGLLTGMILFFRRGGLNKLTLAASALLAVAVECLVIEAFCILAQGAAMKFVWSPFVLAPCLFLSFSLFFINGNRAVREEVRRRVHF